MVKKCKKCPFEKELYEFRLRTRKNKSGSIVEFYEATCKKCEKEALRIIKSSPEYLAKKRAEYALNKDKINTERTAKRKAQPKVYKPKKPKQTKEEAAEKRKEWIRNNPEKRKKSVNKYHETHKEQEKQYALENKDKIGLRQKEYRIKNKVEINKKESEKRKNDPILKLRHNVSTLVRFYIKDSKGGKSILKYLGYTIQDLKEHLEKQFEHWMTWENRRSLQKKFME